MNGYSDDLVFRKHQIAMDRKKRWNALFKALVKVFTFGMMPHWEKYLFSLQIHHDAINSRLRELRANAMSTASH